MAAFSNARFLQTVALRYANVVKLVKYLQDHNIAVQHNEDLRVRERSLGRRKASSIHLVVGPVFAHKIRRNQIGYLPSHVEHH